MNKNGVTLTEKTLGEGMCLNLLNDFIDFQMNISTRSESSKKSIEETLKTVFNAMMVNGDVIATMWDSIHTRLNKASFQTLKLEKLSDKRNTLLNVIDGINNTNTFNGYTMRQITEMSTEDISCMDIKFDKNVFTAMLLVDQANKLIDEANKAIEQSGTNLTDTYTSVLTKYGKLFPKNFVEHSMKGLK